MTPDAPDELERLVDALIAAAYADGYEAHGHDDITDAAEAALLSHVRALPTQARLRAIERERDDLRHSQQSDDKDYQVLRASNARLREALESIAHNSCCDKCQEAALVARAALAPTASPVGDNPDLSPTEDVP